MSKIKDKIEKEIRVFNNQDAKVTEKAEYNQKEIINRALHYYLSEYETGEYDDDGFKKYFLNITRNPTNTTAKALDFDTKDFNFMTAQGGSSEKTWFFEKDFKYWFKRQGFAKTLNRLFKRLSLYGSAIIKTIEGEPHIVDLRNFIIDQEAESLEDANYIIELHPYSGFRFSKKAEENDWEHKEDVLKEFKETEENQIMVYERYGPIRDENGDYDYKRTLLADPGVKRDQDNNKEPGKTYILGEDSWKIDNLPYDEFHLEKIDGRWLGIGIPEILFDAQMRMNEIINLQVKASYWSSKMIFQTRDDGIGRNILTNVKNGEILNVDKEITQVNNSELNLPSYNQEQQVWLNNRNEQTFANTPMKGERMPAGTTLGETKLASRMAQAYFTLIQEIIAEDLKQYLKETVIPYFEEDRDTQHYINLTGEDLTKVREIKKNKQLNRTLLNFVEQNDRFPTTDERKKMEAANKIELKSEEQANIPKDFYENVEFDLDIVITGEQEDTRTQAANLQMAMQMLGQNRTAMQDPVLRKILTKMLEKGGLNIEDIAPQAGESSPSPEEIAQQNAGGGVGTPQPPSTPMPGRVEQKR